MAQDNKPLGQFNLEGISPARRGIPQIEVTFDIDANGIVNVSAKDKATGKEQKITIQASGGLDDNEIEKMVQDAEENAESDKKKREDVETRNQAEALVNGAEKAIEDAGDKADENLKSSVQESLSDLKSVLEGEDLEEIKKKSEALSQVMMKLGEAAYKDIPDQDNSPSEEDKPKNNDADVVDADFEEVDNDKKDK
jgi:molecular chaperone DnaK